MSKATTMMENFKRKYELDLSIEEVEANLKSIKRSNDALTQKYVYTLANLLHSYLEKKLSPLYYRRSLDLTDVNVEEFINDFEKIMEERRDENDTAISQEPFAGLGSKLYDQLIPLLQSLNKPITELWTNSILAGKIDPMDLKHNTDHTFSEMREKKPPLTNVEERTLELSVLTHKAMTQVYEKRGALWRVAPWHWRQWYREAKYIDKLAEQLQTYSQNGLPIEKIKQKYATSHIEKINEKLTNAKNAAAKIEVEELSRKAEEKKQELANKKVAAAENLKQVTADPTFKDRFIDDIVKSLPQTQFTDSMKRDMLSMAYNNIVNTMKIQNLSFDNDFDDPKKHVVAGAKATFKSAYALAKSFGAKSREEHLAIAQIITDKVMQNLSPATVDQKYVEFTNGYALSHAEEFNNALGNENKVGDEEVEQVFANASKVYGKLTREPIIPKELNENLDDRVVEPINQNSKVKDNIIKIN